MERKRFSWVLGGTAIFLVAAAAAVPILGQMRRGDSILLHARMAESGGWTPADLQANVGEPLHLRLTSDDVMHSFAVGQIEMQPVDVFPGKLSEVTLTFDQPGKYTFYCTRWCGLNHWRMRGVIEVEAGETAEATQPDPLYVELGIDIDQPHPAAVTPAASPSAAEGKRLLTGPEAPTLPEAAVSRDYYRANSPAGIWQDLRSEPDLVRFNDRQLWDLSAALIAAQASPEMLAEGKELYAQNCSACHGVNGQGDGVFADQLAGQDTAATLESGHPSTGPSDFTDPQTMLGASPALLQGKIIRGGMGTGMPYWGSVFTDEQTWALVAYIQSFILELENQP